MGLAPQVVKEIFEIIGILNAPKRCIHARRAEHPHGAQISAYGYVLETPRPSWKARGIGGGERDVKAFYLGIAEGKRKSFRDVSIINAASAEWRECG